MAKFASQLLGEALNGFKAKMDDLSLSGEAIPSGSCDAKRQHLIPTEVCLEIIRVHCLLAGSVESKLLPCPSEMGENWTSACLSLVFCKCQQV